MNVIYYYYYLFYKTLVRDSQPHLLARLAISASEAFFIVGVINFMSIKIRCAGLSTLTMFGTMLIIAGINHFVMHKSGKDLEIVKAKPKFFNNNRISIFMVILFFLATTSFMFWGPIYGNYLLSKCR